MELQGWYKVIYKHPMERYSSHAKFEWFRGKCVNFYPSGLCAFDNEQGLMLLVRYQDIVQMKPLLNKSSIE
jgi:hypothetical protein